jgi:hypothetical protein
LIAHNTIQLGLNHPGPALEIGFHKPIHPFGAATRLCAPNFQE